MAKTTKKHMSKQDKEDWESLYNYVRHNVLGYDENQSLSRNMVLRLKGLSSNKFIENNKIDDTANYPYKTILNTFKFCMSDIQRGLRSNSFRDENHKFNYILKIVESNLNTVYLRMINVEKNKQKIETMSMESVMSSGAEYQTKTVKTSERLNDLW